MQPEKLAIRNAFARAVRTYDAAAAVQRQVADRLLTMCDVHAYDAVLDAGCGTGYGAHKLLAAQPHIQCVAFDLATEMAARARTNAVCGDIEKLPFASNCFDLYWSSLAWQWIDPPRAIAEAARVLRPGGTLRVATLGQYTLCELAHAFAHIDRAMHVRTFAPIQNYPYWLAAAGFTHCEIGNEKITVFADDLRGLLHEIKALGAHVVGSSRRRGLLGRNAWRQLEDRYAELRTPQGLPATYDVVYLSATRLRS
ncbi:MAG TPA: malonyl-ACP O-methyltransferase BioC [Rhodocyclaceae bacterium]|nr:malonyl-ACP O-methyltransferase BioC [Rhodocyclaceae bacterium]